MGVWIVYYVSFRQPRTRARARPCFFFFPVFSFVSSARRVYARACVGSLRAPLRVEGVDDGRARDVVAREHEMAEIETTYQVIKYEVRTRADVGESAMGDDGWMGG